MRNQRIDINGLEQAILRDVEIPYLGSQCVVILKVGDFQELGKASFRLRLNCQ